MIVDSSALVAILTEEESAPALLSSMAGEPSISLSAASYLETSIVVDNRHDSLASASLDELIKQFEIDVVPVTAEHARIARAANRKFGKGSGHPAQLNFGDCFAYALAISRDEPLLFIGNDFIHTDVKPALEP